MQHNISTVIPQLTAFTEQIEQLEILSYEVIQDN